MVPYLIDIIQQAVCNVSQDYFRLQTTYEPSGIVRERVFCYELYHQIRLLLGNDHRITLNGEIDKRGHIDFDIEDRVNPDFVFHTPGSHRGNTIVFEVKGVLTEGIVKDFRTLSTFINKYHYEAGVFLLYNHTREELSQRFGDRLSHFKGSYEATAIHIVTVPSPDQVEDVIRLSDL